MAGLDDGVHVAPGAKVVKGVDMDGRASNGGIAGNEIILGIGRASIKVKVRAVTGKGTEAVKSGIIREAGVKTVEDGAELIRENLGIKVYLLVVLWLCPLRDITLTTRAAFVDVSKKSGCTFQNICQVFYSKKVENVVKPHDMESDQ